MANLQIKILIVDDDKVIADILFDLIADEQRSVDVCYDGLAAIECIQKTSYDLIIVDLVMPKVGGLEILKYVKKTNPDSIVIILTGYASLETAIMAIREGAYDYIRKPCKLEEIKIVIDNAIDKIRLNRENRELLAKLQDAYRELMVSKKDGDEKTFLVVDEKKENINFFSPSPPNLHYLYNTDSPSNNYVDKLQALISLKDNGMLTENEFKEFKGHLLKMISLNG
ncbi:MAG: response regulator [Deltaproteobacteria bacterium]|nr:response regulator [Deltaproteobacteria bacterium]